MTEKQAEALREWHTRLPRHQQGAMMQLVKSSAELYKYADRCRDSGLMEMYDSAIGAAEAHIMAATLLRAFQTQEPAPGPSNAS